MTRQHDNKRAKYANCRVEFLDTHEEYDVTIKLSTEVDEDEDGRVFYYCESPDELQSLTVEGAEDFVIREIYSYEY